MSEVVLGGLDGSNPLAFLAALGVLRVLDERGVDARLAWRDVGAWRPVVSGIGGAVDTLVRVCDEDRTACGDEPALLLEYDGVQDLKPPPAEFRRYLRTLVERAAPDQRRGVDWAAAFATDVAVDGNGNTKPSALHFTAGQQEFLRMARELQGCTTPDDLAEALVGPWRYERKLPVLGWDATASRDYALRARNPSGDKKAGVPGADWLALRGLAFVGAVPRGSQVRTTGCVGGWKSGRFRWPLWSVPLPAPVVRSVLRLDVVAMPARERRARGVCIAFECGIRRSDQGGYGSFTPATVV